jgi:serine/threonine-protein kinase HipA
MTKKMRTVKSLEIYLNALPLGSLLYGSRKDMVFQYNEQWLERPNSFPISRTLPLREQPYQGAQVFAFFDNLLPDNISIRQRIAARMRATSDQVFDLLAVVGRDCVGAMQFIKSGEPAPVIENAKGVAISNSEIANKLKDLRMTPLAVSQEQDFRLSIAGAQDKTAFLCIDENWYLPKGATPTTHIFKPQINELNSGLSFSNSVENEWLCSRIVSAFGLPVADCEVKMFGSVKVLVVKRFDRTWLKEKLIRLPQEDLCQALSVPNFEKYESDGGPGIVKIMDVLIESNNRDVDRRNFMKAQVVFYLLAAIDGHAKNFSLGWRGEPSGFGLMPLYDILSAQPIVDSGKYDFEKLKMAMALGVNRHYRIKEIYKRHFLQTAKLCRFDQGDMQVIMDECVSQIPNVIKVVKAELPKKFPAKIASSIFQGMKNRGSRLQG